MLLKPRKVAAVFASALVRDRSICRGCSETEDLVEGILVMGDLGSVGLGLGGFVIGHSGGCCFSDDVVYE